MRCEGYRRYGGVFSFGPVTWVQCKNEAIVNVTVIQEGKEESFYGCLDCWKECIAFGIEIKRVVPAAQRQAD